MRMRKLLWAFGLAGVAMACGQDSRLQQTSSVAPATVSTGSPMPAADAPIFMCPMDKDVRSYKPGECPRCGMTLVAGLPDPVEYHLTLDVTPPPSSGNLAHLNFQVFDPWKDHLVTRFTLVHERLFHAFVVSRDLQFFAHGHPAWNGASFTYDLTFPKPGMYRVLGDFYPEASTPQLITKTLFVAGEEAAPVPLTRDYETKQAANVRVALVTSPGEPVAGVLTQMRFTMTPAEGVERYLGAWAHMLAAER